MEQTQQEQFIIRRIGGTTYKVRVAFSETAAETMEEKILRMIRNEGGTNDGTYAIMEAPQMSRQSERRQQLHRESEKVPRKLRPAERLHQLSALYG